MAISRKLLVAVYALIGLVALLGTWANNVHYLELGIVGANVHFWQETFANPASRSITVDLLFLTLAAVIWMVLEARRLAMRGVWLYVLAGVFIAISVAFPLFLIHRERTLAARGESTGAASLYSSDIAGVALLGLVAVAYACYSLNR